MAKRKIKKFDLSDLFLWPKKDAEKVFLELRRTGLMFTPHERFEQFCNNPYDAWLVYSLHTKHLKKNEIVLGPFPLLTDEYAHFKNFLASVKAKERNHYLLILLSFRKLEYDKTGFTGKDFAIRMDNKYTTLTSLANILSLYELDNPYIGKYYTWFYPGKKMKKKIEKIEKAIIPDNDFSWWKSKVDLKVKIDSPTLFDKKRNYFLVPILDEWYKYLPDNVPLIIYHLCYKLCQGGFFKELDAVSDIISLIREGRHKFKERGVRKHRYSKVDRELLIKELLEYNNLQYPTSDDEILDFLVKLEFITVVKKKGKVKYRMNKNIPSAKNKIKEPPRWRNKTRRFIEKGTIIFDYIELEELLKLSRKFA